MQTDNEITQPNFTLRVLLDHAETNSGEKVEMKPFAHFTLGCTESNELSLLKRKLPVLINSYFLNQGFSLKANQVINLGSEDAPLWGVTLDLGKTEDSLRAALSDTIDSVMSHERNGIKYTWAGKPESRCPHITIGRSEGDKVKAEQLVAAQCSFNFKNIDYKQVGPHDPMHSWQIEKSLTSIFEAKASTGSVFSVNPLPCDELISAFIAPYRRLDKNLFKNDTETPASYQKKFNNFRSGVNDEIKQQLLIAANAILNGAYMPREPLMYVDALTLFSNHIDQEIHKKNLPTEIQAVKEKLVLKLLSAAYKVSPQTAFDDSLLDSSINPNELSSHAQLLHYLGKAERYSKLPDVKSPSNRINKLQRAYEIAVFLDGQNLSYDLDPHKYAARAFTYVLPVVYTKKDLHLYDDAIALLQPALQGNDHFHAIQAYVQLSSCYQGKFEMDANPEWVALAVEHARNAVRIAQDTGDLRANAAKALMEALYVAGEYDEAKEVAETMIANAAEPDLKKAIGIKDFHIADAHKVIDQISLAQTNTMTA